MKSSLQIEALGLSTEIKHMISTQYNEPMQTCIQNHVCHSKVKNVLILTTYSQQ